MLHKSTEGTGTVTGCVREHSKIHSEEDVHSLVYHIYVHKGA